MITGTYWDKPNRSNPAVYLADAGGGNAYVMVVTYPTSEQLLSPTPVQVCVAKEVADEGSINWTDQVPPIAGFYVTD